MLNKKCRNPKWAKILVNNPQGLNKSPLKLASRAKIDSKYDALFPDNLPNTVKIPINKKTAALMKINFMCIPPCL